jgi:hypothetical protein
MSNEVGLTLRQWEENKIVPLQNKLANFITQMQSLIETNNDGIPLSYIDPTLIAECIPYAESTDDIPDEKYKQAITRIDFEDGTPIVAGIPFWERLDGEPFDHYKTFKEYREMKYQNATHFNSRSLASLGEMLNIPGKLLGILAKIYHWAPRIKAYDRHRAHEFALQRARNAEQLEVKHASYSNEILEQAITYLKSHPQALNAKTALQMVELGMKYGRISAGLLGDKPGNDPRSTPVHQTNIAINANSTLNTADQMVNINGQEGNEGSPNGGVGRKLANSLKDTDNLASILHVLNKSGAFKSTKGAEVIEVEVEVEATNESDGDEINDATAGNEHKQ